MRVAVTLVFLQIGLGSSETLADVPYSDLEKLRRLTVVTRVLSDAPETPAIQACKVEPSKAAAAGQKLQLEFENAKAGWDKSKIIMSDLARLNERIELCSARGSCQIYEAFLSSADHADETKAEIEKLQKVLNERLASLPSSTYVQALETVPNVCQCLAKVTAD